MGQWASVPSSAAASSKNGNSSQASPSAGPLLDDSASSSPGGQAAGGGSMESPIVRDVNHKFKSLNLDPRSPSGIPRTPILVEDGGSGSGGGGGDTPRVGPAGTSSDTPARGANADQPPPRRGKTHKSSALPQSKLSFEEDSAVASAPTLKPSEASPVIIETVVDEIVERAGSEMWQEGGDENGPSAPSAPAKAVLAEGEEARAKPRSPLANVSNSEDRSMVI